MRYLGETVVGSVAGDQAPNPPMKQEGQEGTFISLTTTAGTPGRPRMQGGGWSLHWRLNWGTRTVLQYWSHALMTSCTWLSVITPELSPKSSLGKASPAARLQRADRKVIPVCGMNIRSLALS